MSDKKIRCAIYTRKSTEEGLEQEFNSLQAQREACEAYIKSQKHEHWQLLPTAYDDGGYSGGNMERPALKRLLLDVQNGLVNIIVVYKIDRLTRSLMDFSKIVEVLDKHNASFVSITQHFNTTTSMGRLTLNMLLSFAQFEREVTGERIRDKISASKKKGMWMGGKPPLGYYRKDKKIYPDEEKVPLVRSIFEKYIEFKSTTPLKEWLNKQGHNISVGNLNCILRNKAYIGLVGHKGIWYPGEHEGIIPIELFEQVQTVMADNRINRQHYDPSKSLLSGKLYDDKDNAMSPSWSTGSSGKKYRYYVSQALIRKEPGKVGKVSKVSLPKLEQFIDNWFSEFLKDKNKIYPYIQKFGVSKQKEIIKRLPSYPITRDVEKELIKRVKLNPNKIEVTLYQEQVSELFNAIYENREMAILKPEKLKNETTYTETYHIGTVANGTKVIVGQFIQPTRQPNKELIKILNQAYIWHQDVISGTSTQNIAKRDKVCVQYVRRILNLSFLSPKIVRTILNGTQPADCTLKKMLSIKTSNWQEQEQSFYK
ncbi:recombinase family protein [Candidatus Avelusimicrobium fimicolum]|uniref:recombinase family protein n=1 Tax=Candidatus Avelusimicrobium fimicolum TaxID=3416216 RepID=UPI003D0B5794